MHIDVASITFDDSVSIFKQKGRLFCKATADKELADLWLIAARKTTSTAHGAPAGQYLKKRTAYFCNIHYEIRSLDARDCFLRSEKLLSI